MLEHTPLPSFDQTNSVCKLPDVDTCCPTTSAVDVQCSSTTSVPDTDTATDIAATDVVMEEISSKQPYQGSPLSTPNPCKKCAKKSITIRRLQKNNSYLRRTAQALRERLNKVSINKAPNYVLLCCK